MKRQRPGTHILLVALLIFSSSIGWLLQGDKKEVALNQGKRGIAELPVIEAIEILLPLMVSRSVDKLVAAMNYISAQQAHDIVKGIINTQQFNLLRDDILALIFGLAGNYSDMADQFILFNLMLENKKLQAGTPFIFIAAKTNPALIASLLDWMRDRKATDPSFFIDAENKALYYAVDTNAQKELSSLLTQLHVSSALATQLLWHAIETNRSPAIVVLLIKSGAFINDNRNGMSPLMKAIDNNNLDLIKVLIEHGADPNALYDPAIGNPLQRVVGKKNVDKNVINIELFLREHGARE